MYVWYAILSHFVIKITSVKCLPLSKPTNVSDQFAKILNIFLFCMCAVFELILSKDFNKKTLKKAYFDAWRIFWQSEHFDALVVKGRKMIFWECSRSLTMTVVLFAVSTLTALAPAWFQEFYKRHKKYNFRKRGRINHIEYRILCGNHII